MKKYIRIALSICLLFVVTACLSQEQKQIRDEVEKEALIYMQDKYNMSFTVEEVSYIYNTSGEFSSATDNIRVDFSDGSRCIWYGDTDTFADDKQATIILASINNQILQPMIENNLSNSIIYEDIDINYYYQSGNCDGNFFTTYFDGNINDFIKNETIIIKGTLFDVVDEDTWYNEINDFCDSYEDAFGFNLHSSLSLEGLSQNAYQRYISDETIFGISTNEWWCDYHIGDYLRKKEQHYIQVTDTIEMTSNTYNLNFNDGDIQLIKFTDSDTWLNDYMTSENYTFDINGDIYQMVISDDLKDKEINMYIRYSGEDTLYYTSEKGTRYDYSFSLSGGRDAHFYSYDEDDVFWIGTQSKVEYEYEGIPG
ncbi:MAG: hypothetical protein LUG46_06745 [Erysipelotrichaceae bacterium]|nr:hypothetical protein [Erysipelotrichaceae bacterium]